MPKSLAEIRAEKSRTRPERPLKVVIGEGQKYVPEVGRLSERLDALEAELVFAQARADQTPRKTGQSSSPEVDEARVHRDEVRDQLAELVDAMGEYEGEIMIRATRTDGEWAQWRIAHPARDEGEPGYGDDLQITYGYCNADDLLADLATYVVAWNGETLEDGDFEALNILRPDAKAVARIVVALYEVGDQLPKLRSDLSGILKSEISSN